MMMDRRCGYTLCLSVSSGVLQYIFILRASHVLFRVLFFFLEALLFVFLEIGQSIMPLRLSSKIQSRPISKNGKIYIDHCSGINTVLEGQDRLLASSPSARHTHASRPVVIARSDHGLGSKIIDKLSTQCRQRASGCLSPHARPSSN